MAAIVVAGVVWFSWDLAASDGPARGGDRFDRIDAYVEAELADARIPGASLAVVDGGAVVHARGFGHDGRGNEVTADTPFWIGSNTKSITALAVMQLVEAGDVDLDEPVQTYLPGFRVADEAASAQMTVRHLLNQRSGIARSDGLRAVVEADPDDSIDDVVATMADLELAHPVGERFEYANLNSVVLGAVVEAVTGERWDDHVQAQIFDPLGMDRTFTDRDAATEAGLTATHRTFFGFPLTTEGEHQPGLAPSGYVYASAHDMARYLLAYLDGGELDGQRVLSADGIDEMLAPATDERTFPLQSHEFTARYGAGWFVGSFGSVDDARWHQGSLPHFTTWMVLLPDSEQAVIVMVNAGNQFEIAGANAAWSRMPRGVVDILAGAEPPTSGGTTRFFVVFGTLVALAVLAQGWTLARLLTDRHPRRRSRAGRLAPLGWELVVAPLLIVGYPAAAGGLGWGAAFTFVPDLSLSIAVIAGLAVATGLARVARLRSSRRRAAGAPSTAPSPDPLTTPAR